MIWKLCMDARYVEKEHKLTMIGRQQGQISGITKVISIEEQQIILITEVGKLTISGKELHAGKLDVVTGVLEFSGRVIGVSYQDYKSPGQKASGFVGKLFK